MVRYALVVFVLLLSGCSLLPDASERPELVEPEQEVLDLDFLEQGEYASFTYPDEVQSIVKNAPVLSMQNTEKGTIYYEVGPDAVDDGSPRYILLSVEDAFLIRDLYVAARENKKLADELIRINELSVDERNQLLRILKAEAYRIQRMKAFNAYYRDEIKRVETNAAIETWSTRILAALALLVAI